VRQLPAGRRPDAPEAQPQLRTDCCLFPQIQLLILDVKGAFVRSPLQISDRA